MKKIKLFLKFVLVAFISMNLSGCFEEQSPYLVESTIDLQNPNGIYELLLYKGMQEAFEKIDWGRYQNKKIFYCVEEITDGYLDNVVSALADHKFLAVGGKILVVNKAGENKDKSEKEIKKEMEYDYDVYITVPISGVYYYEGFFRRNYIAYVMINLFEKQKSGSEHNFSSGIIEKRFDQFIPSKVFTVCAWVLILSGIILSIIKILFKKLSI